VSHGKGLGVAGVSPSLGSVEVLEVGFVVGVVSAMISGKKTYEKISLKLWGLWFSVLIFEFIF